MTAMLWSYTVTFILIAVILAYFYSTRKFNYWKRRNVKFIKPIPIFGNLLSVFRTKHTLGEWLAESYRKFDGDDFFGVFLFDQPVLVIKSPKLVKALLQKDFSYFQDRSAVHPDNDPILSNLMFLANNPKWKTLRSKVSPVFTSGKLKLMFGLILEETKTMTNYIEGLINIPNVESKEICAKYSTNVIAKCAFAVDAKSFENHDAEFRTLGRRIFDFRYSNAFRQLGAWLLPNVVQFFNLGFIDSQTVNRLRRIFKEVLHSRMASKFFKGQDLVDIMVEANKTNNGEIFDENAMLGEAIQFFVAGFETVSSTLCFTLYELCIHPDIQSRLRTEILDSIQKHNGITYDGIFEMKYLDMCVSETLRKYPVLPFLDRVCKSDYKLPDSDLVIEKGIPIYVPLFGLHYDSNLFPEPEKYNPERFKDKDLINQDGLYYVPFGEGPRICIGARFGLIGVKLGIAAVLSKYKLEVTDKTPIPMQFETKSLLLQSTVGVPLKFVPL